MADLVIRGMEMPNKDEILVFDVWHGKVYARSTANTGTRRYEVVFLPEGHGRLIDGTDLYAVLDGGFDVDLDELPETKDAILQMIQSAETIVPEEGGEADA